MKRNILLELLLGWAILAVAQSSTICHQDGTVTFNLLYTFEKENKIYRREKFEEHYIPLSKSIILKTLEEMGYHDVNVSAFPSQCKYEDIEKVDWFTILAQK